MIASSFRDSRKFWWKGNDQRWCGFVMQIPTLERQDLCHQVGFYPRGVERFLFSDARGLPFEWVCDSFINFFNETPHWSRLVERCYDREHVEAIRACVGSESTNGGFFFLHESREGGCNQVVVFLAPGPSRCGRHIWLVCKTFWRPVQRFLFRIFEMFLSGEYVTRFVSLLNWRPHWSGWSSRHDCEHFCAIHVNSGWRKKDQRCCAYYHESRYHIINFFVIACQILSFWKISYASFFWYF